MGEREDILRRALEVEAQAPTDGGTHDAKTQRRVRDALAEADRLPPDDAQQRLAQIADVLRPWMSGPRDGIHEAIANAYGLALKRNRLAHGEDAS